MKMMEEQTEEKPKYERLNKLIDGIGFRPEFERLQQAGATIDDLAESFEDITIKLIRNRELSEESIEYKKDFLYNLTHPKILFFMAYYLKDMSVSHIANNQLYSYAHVRQNLQDLSEKYLGVNYRTQKPKPDEQIEGEDKYHLTRIKLSLLKSEFYKRTLNRIIAPVEEESSKEGYDI